MGACGHHVVLIDDDSVEPDQATLHFLAPCTRFFLAFECERVGVARVPGLRLAGVHRVRIHAQQVDPGTIHQQDHVGVQEVHIQRDESIRPLGLWHLVVFDVLESQPGRKDHAVVAVKNIARLQVAMNFGGQRIFVQHIKMIVLAERVDRKFPVDVGVKHLMFGIGIFGQVPALHLVAQSAQQGIGVDVAADGGFDPQHAVVFRRGQRDEAAVALVDAAEFVLVVDGDEFAAVAIGPGVERARKSPAPAASPRDHLHTPMPTDVEKGAELAVIASRHQNGHAGLVGCQVAAVFRQVGGHAEEEGRVAKECLLLSFQKVRAREV